MGGAEPLTIPINGLWNAEVINDEGFQTTKLFYLLDTPEFDFEDNWNIIEEFLDSLRHRDKIWFATKYEICDYIRSIKV